MDPYSRDNLLDPWLHLDRVGQVFRRYRWDLKDLVDPYHLVGQLDLEDLVDHQRQGYQQSLGYL